MTGIGGFPSPFNRVQSTLQRDAGAGTISATDATALTSALGDIQAQLSGAAATTASTGAATGAASAPASMKDRVNAAIDNEVSSGKLTSDQASELKTAFQQVQQHMHGAHGHHGGGGGAGGLLAALTGTSSTDGQATDTTGSGTTASDPLAATATNATTTAAGAIEAFITQFKSALGSNGLYGASGAGANSTTSLLVNAIG